MKCNLSIAIRYQVSYDRFFLFKHSLKSPPLFFGRSTTSFASDNCVGECYSWPWSIRKPARHSRTVNRGSPPRLLPDIHPRTRPHSTTYKTGRSREVLCRRRRASFCWINYMQVFYTFFLIFLRMDGWLPTPLTEGNPKRIFYLPYLRWTLRVRLVGATLYARFKCYIQNSLFGFPRIGLSMTCTWSQDVYSNRMNHFDLPAHVIVRFNTPLGQREKIKIIHGSATW